MAALSGAYHGYLHQDAVTAYLLATLLLSGAPARTLSAERRVISDDCFDDIELRGTSRRRIQVKSHQVECRPLQLRDFTTQEISFRRTVPSEVSRRKPALQTNTACSLHTIPRTRQLANSLSPRKMSPNFFRAFRRNAIGCWCRRFGRKAAIQYGHISQR